MKLTIQNLKNKYQRWLDGLIDNTNHIIDRTNIRTIFMTSLTIFFSLLFLLKANDVRVIATEHKSQVNIDFVAGNDAIITMDTKVDLKQHKKKQESKRITSKELKFISEITETVKIESDKFGIPMSIKIAQSAIESGWGEDVIATKYNNYYGIKAKKGFDDNEKALVKGRVNKRTNEYVKGSKIRVTGIFVVYKSRWNSIRHHSIFLRGRIDNEYNNGYAKMKNLPKQDYKKWAKALQEAKYSTNPNYAKNLINIIESYKLYKLDK